MSSLVDVVRAGRAKAVPELVKSMTAAERKEALTGLKALRAEVRDWSWDRWAERQKVHDALLIAGTGCLTGAADTAAWLGSREMRGTFEVEHEPLLGLLAERDARWLGNLAHRLAGRTATARVDYPLIAGLVRLAGCALPDTDEFVYGWVDAAGARGGPADSLRDDPWLAVMVPRLFTTADVPGPFTRRHDDPRHWASVLPALAAEGLVERRPLVDGTIARLLRGGRRPADSAFFLSLLGRLEPTAGEKRDHLADWTAMAADGTPTVAEHAQRVLAELAVSGALPTRDLADVSGSVLFRPERRLVRAQLVLVGKVLRADPGAAGALLPVVAETFGHEDSGIQERALKLVARHLPAVDAGIRSELAGYAALLAPVHRARAVEVFGEPVADADRTPYEEILPPVPLPTRSRPAPSDLAELVEEVSALISSRAVPGECFERVLDGLVRHAYRDRQALAAALRAALAGRWWLREPPERDLDNAFGWETHQLEVVTAAVCGLVSVRTLRDAAKRAAAGRCCAHTVLDGVVDARFREVAHLMCTRPLPFLLATPTWETGALDPEVLVERLGEYRRLSVTPAPVDFAQALLRVRRAGHPEAARAAAALGTPEADRLAAWLTGGGAALPALDLAEVPEPRDGDGSPEGRPRWPGLLRPVLRPVLRPEKAGRRPTVRREFPPAFHWLDGPVRPTRSGCFHWEEYRNPGWPKVLPEDPDTLAGWLLPGVAACAKEDHRGGAWWLLPLAEGGGTAGRSLHRAVAYGLGARQPQDRLSAVDALLVLAARGDLDGRSLGAELGGLVRSGAVKPNRLVDSVRTAAATGAYATVWSVLGAALPPLLAPVPGDGKSTRSRSGAGNGIGEILSVAADCAERCGAAQEIRGLPELAGRGGTSRAVAQAARLLAALRQGSERSRP
ncbi:DUF6493 family protein [Streptomyces sp. NPDC012623]|uniref:DUF7824 domain-containing protein n=1 Tax=unclassified Streptomyces TaxID=2593676 RepID=UPI00367F2C68